MQSTGSEPYIAAVLAGAQTELDLSGNKPFSFNITLTLHAKAPILCYIGEDNTFFLPQLALHDVGIVFRDHKTKQQISSSHLDICRITDSQSGPARPLIQHTRLYLQPEKPVVIEVPFTGDKNSGCEHSFDPSFYMATCGFKAGRTYEATLPADRKISWWRWANFWEVEGQGQEASATTSMLWSVVRFGVSRWTGDKERTQGVPVLPENEQLPMYVEDDGVIFSCVGKSMEWPSRSEEEER